ncbi:MAG: putative manganese-dependent inorganic diphosphatase, partial [Verrucomicrobiaceae bacterium]|nr:putative manganese-dependent inorganic diphosphatase [Verrucomicrobiaceae bacterium]
HNSVLLVAGNQRVVVAIEYPQFHKRLFEMRGVVSRKKQLFPYLSRIVGKITAP